MNKKELKAKFKAFVKKHEKVIVLTTAVVGGVVVYVVGKKAYGKTLKKNSVKAPEIDWAKIAEENKAKIAPNWSTGVLTEVFNDGTDVSLEAIVNELKPTDLGKVGEDILKCAGITENDTVSAMLYVWKPDEK